MSSIYRVKYARTCQKELLSSFKRVRKRTKTSKFVWLFVENFQSALASIPRFAITHPTNLRVTTF